MNTLKPSDVLAATAPAVSATVLGQINDMIGIVGGLVHHVAMVVGYHHKPPVALHLS